jgi:hypothetical protein
MTQPFSIDYYKQNIKEYMDHPKTTIPITIDIPLWARGGLAAQIGLPAPRSPEMTWGQFKK